MEHCFDFDSLPDVVRRFIMHEFQIEIESTDDAYEITRYLNDNRIGWFAEEGCFEEIQKETLAICYKHDKRYITFNCDESYEGVYEHDKKNMGILTVTEFLEEATKTNTIYGFNDWETIA